MSQEPEFVSYAKGCMSCLVLLIILVVIGELVVQSIGVGGVVTFIVAGVAILGVALYRWLSASAKEGQ